MCGIVGYIGNKDASNVIVEGLKKLEYRGYDSSGLVLETSEGLTVRKYKGRIAVLEEKLQESPVASNVGVGHTRWATHGAPSDHNSHPHMSQNGKIAVVHNGIIENYMELREELTAKGYEFKSETDTEVVAHLLQENYESDLMDAVYKTLERLRGAYALGIVCEDEKDRMIAARKDSPLIIGLGKGENFIASDIPAILDKTRDVYLINDGEVVELKKDSVTIFDENRNEVKRDIYHVEWDVESATKAGFDHFMLKEIHEQPKGILETLQRRIDEDNNIHLDDIKMTKEEIENINRIYIVACGTAYHAGLMGKYAIEKIAKIPVQVEIASEFRYSDPFVDENTLVIAVSQSGETLDTLAALREGKRKGARILTISNVVGASIPRESDDVFYTWAGPEIAVASTKAYTTQLTSFYMIAIYMAQKKGILKEDKIKDMIKGIESTSKKVQEVIENSDSIKEVAKQFVNKEHAFYIGRGMDFVTSMEASLKLKEISYIHSEAFAAGELKHGTIALIEEGTPVIGIATQDDLFEKTVSNLKEVKARGAYVIGVAQEGNKAIENVADEVIYIPKVDDIFASIVSVVPVQLLAYYVATAKGCDVDKPRNLAKSVTVE